MWESLINFFEISHMTIGIKFYLIFAHFILHKRFLIGSEDAIAHALLQDTVFFYKNIYIYNMYNYYYIL